MPLSFTTKQIIKSFSLNSADRFVPRDIATVDLNRDGKLDLVTNGIAVFLGDGTGNFTAVSLPDFAKDSSSNNLIQSEYAADVTGADLNRDGNPDVVSVSEQKITTLLGDGTGSFSSAQTSPTEIDPQSIALSDFNGDGNLDALTLHSSYYRSDNQSIQSVLLHLGDGQGRFSNPASIPLPIATASKIEDVTVADFNGDGQADLAVSSNVEVQRKGTSIFQNQVTVLLGNGTGQFRPVDRINLDQGGVNRLTAADFNGDGKDDLAVAGNNLNILLGSSSGKLKPQHRALLRNFDGLTSGDFNGDGTLDLVTTTGYAGAVNANVFLGDGQGNFSNFPQRFSASVSYDRSDESNGYDVVAGDFNGDGKLDFATADGRSYTEGTVTIFLNSTTSSQALVVDEFAVDASIVSKGSIRVDLAKRTLQLTQPKFRTRLNRFVNDVIGTRQNDTLRGNDANFNNRSNFLNGFAGDDVILGLGGNDRIIGGAGDDNLTGGDGKDRFIFSSTPNYPEGLNQSFRRSLLGVDRIEDFETGRDKIILDRGTFTALGRKVSFASVDDSTEAATSNAIITHIRSNGALYYNENGAQAGLGAGGLFAVLENTAALRGKDFSVFT